MKYDETIVVGVNGSAGSAAAVRYAAREAIRRDAALRVVHVPPTALPVYPAAYEMCPAELEAAGRRILGEAAALARDYVASDRVTTALLKGQRAQALVSEAAGAALLVLGDESLPYAERLVTGWAGDEVIARCATPVALVPSTWRAVGERRIVVAGIRDPRRSLALIEIGLQEARRRDARLVLLHAAYRPGLEDDDLARGVDPELWLEEDRRILDEVSAPLRERYADVPVELRIEQGRPSQVLQGAAGRAGLLLLTRRPSSAASGAFGLTGRALLHGVPCPVEVLPPAREWALPGPRAGHAVEPAEEPAAT
ncbi:universal stress protein [Nocardioides sp. KR10-350]|uniref:universal stress protein n=1 Tax=Nocardioides cheoyonin TaxID=3156615 RepID=UPI0032B35669